MRSKYILFIVFSFFITQAVIGQLAKSTPSFDEIRIYTNEMMDPDVDQNHPVTGVTTRYGTKPVPAAENIIRWCVNAEDNTNHMLLGSDYAAEGPLGMKLGMGKIPSNNCWLDIRRSDAAEGWNTPLDVSGTGRITFWIKADAGTAPFWFHGEGWKPSNVPIDNPAYNANLNQGQKSTNVYVDGETVIIKDEFGEFKLLRDTHFNGEWQFVSIPMDFLTETDSTIVSDILPWSFPWSGSAKDPEPDSPFDPRILKTLKWHTNPESPSVHDAYWASEGNLWSNTPEDYTTVSPGLWMIDEVRFMPSNNVAESPKELFIYKNEMMDPDVDQNHPVTGVTTRYGTKPVPAAENIIRWCVNAEDNTNHMLLGSDYAAEGPLGMKLGMGKIPSNNCWLDIRRSDAAEGWNTPFDVSATDRVSFWIKADAGTAPFWFHGEGWKPSNVPIDNPAYNADLNQGQKSTNVYVDGETVIIKDEYGEFKLLRDTHFNGEWQFVSIPMDFLTETDSTIVSDVLPWSFPWSGSAKDPEPDSPFDPRILKTLKWHTNPESPSVHDAYWASEGNLWSNTPEDYTTVSPGLWYIDEVVFSGDYDGGNVTGVETPGHKKSSIVTYELHNAYPNPFNPSTTIQYTIPVSNNVTIDVYNIMGQRVRTLVNEFKTVGNYSAVWNGRNDSGANVATGIYIFKMKASHFQSTQKVILMK